MCQLREHLARIFFPAHCTCMNFFWHDGLVQEFFSYAYALAGYFFSKSPTPPPPPLRSRMVGPLDFVTAPVRVDTMVSTVSPEVYPSEAFVVNLKIANRKFVNRKMLTIELPTLA